MYVRACVLKSILLCIFYHDLIELKRHFYRIPNYMLFLDMGYFKKYTKYCP